MAHGLMPGFVDSHCHLWDLAATPQEWIDPDSMGAIHRDFRVADLDSVLAERGARGAVIVQANNTLAETRFLLDEALASALDHTVVGWIDLTGDVHAQLAGFAGHPAAARLVGIRHLAHVDPDPVWLERDDVAAGVRALAQAGLTFDIVVRAQQLPQATALARRVPEASFVLDHLGNPPQAAAEQLRWSADLRQLAELPNVVAKISGLASSDAADAVDAADAADGAAADRFPAAAISVALDAFGPSRLMFGSDWPLVRLSDAGYGGWVDRVLSALDALSDSERTHILRDTASATYGGAA